MAGRPIAGKAERVGAWKVVVVVVVVVAGNENRSGKAVGESHFAISNHDFPIVLHRDALWAKVFADTVLLDGKEEEKALRQGVEKGSWSLE